MDKDTVSKLKNLSVYFASFILLCFTSIIAFRSFGVCAACLVCGLFSIVYFLHSFLDRKYRTELKESSMWTRTILRWIFMVAVVWFWAFIACVYYS